jgi:SAM-dependent methyltransferase
MTDPEEHVRNLAAEALAGANPTGWFERLYAEADAGDAVVPWDRGSPHRLLVRWTQNKRLHGEGKRALVVGCGLGEDAEFVSAFGYDTFAFDVSATAIRNARERFPSTKVRYRTADLLDPPDNWPGSFDLVVESLTVQSLPDSLRDSAIGQVSEMVGPGGTLVVIAAVWEERAEPEPGPPWPLTKAEVEAFATGSLRAATIEEVVDAGPPETHRWLAEFHRPRKRN